MSQNEGTMMRWCTYLLRHNTGDLPAVALAVQVLLAVRLLGHIRLLRKLEANIFLIDGRTHHAAAAFLAKHKVGSKLGATARTSVVLLLSSESSETRGGKALRLGTALMALLRIELFLNFTFFPVCAVVLVALHHGSQVGSERIEVARQGGVTKRRSLAVFRIRSILDAGECSRTWLEDWRVDWEIRGRGGRRLEICWWLRRSRAEVSDNSLKRGQGIARFLVLRGDWRVLGSWIPGGTRALALRR